MRGKKVRTASRRAAPAAAAAIIAAAAVLALAPRAALRADEAGALLPPLRFEPPEKPKAAAPPRLDAAGQPLPEGAVARFGARPRLFASPFRSLAGFVLGERAVVFALERTLRVVDLASGEEVRAVPVGGLEGHGAGGDLIAVCEDEQVLVYDARTGEITQSLPKRGYGGAVRLSDDGTRAVTLERAGARVWDLATGKEIRRFERGDLLGDPVPSPGGREIGFVAVLRDAAPDEHFHARFEVHDVETGEEVRKVALRFKGGAPREIAVAGGLSALAYGDADRTHARVLDLETGEESRAIAAKDARFLALSDDGGRLAVVETRDKALRILDLETGKETARFAAASGFRFPKFSSSGRWLAVEDGFSVRVFDVAAGREVLGRPSFACGVSSLAFSADGRRLIAAFGDWTIRAFDATSGKVLAREAPAEIGNAAFVPAWRKIAPAVPVPGGRFSADGALMSESGAEQKIKVSETVSGKEVRTLGPGRHQETQDFALSPDGRFLASVGKEPALRTFDLRSGKEALKFDRPGKEARAVAFSPDGKLLAAHVSDEGIFLWDAATGKGRGTIRSTSYVSLLAFSADAGLIAAASSDEFSVFDVRTRERVGEFPGAHEERIYSIAFSPDGKIVATGSGDTTIVLWPARGRE